MSDFTSAPDYFDSREVIERIEELETLLENAEDTELSDDDRAEALEEFDRKEYDALIALRDGAEGNIPDWQYGETFIREDEFTAYAMELLSDTGYLSADLPSWIIIDEEETADNMKVDYTEFEFMGTTYYAR